MKRQLLTLFLTLSAILVMAQEDMPFKTLYINRFESLTDGVNDDTVKVGNMLDLETNRVINAGDPVNAQDLATKAYVDALDVTVSEEDVTQHEAALSITESQISDLDHYTDADISGSEAVFSGWDKNAADDFSGDYDDLTDVPATFTPATHSHTESQISDLDHYTDADISGSETAFSAWDKNASDDAIAASAFATDNRLLRSDGTGRGAQSSGITVDDNNNVSGAVSYSAANGIAINGNILDIGTAGNSLTGGRVGIFRNNATTHTSSVVEIIQDNAAATSVGLRVQQDGVLDALSVVGNSNFEGSLTAEAGNFSGLLTINREAGSTTYTVGQIGGVTKWAAGYEDANSRYVIRDVAGGVYGLTIANNTGAAIFAGPGTFNNIIDRGSTTDLLQVSGGSGSGSGRNILLYAGSHATLANYVRFRRGTSVDLEIDGSGNVSTNSGSFSAGAITGTSATFSSESGTGSDIAYFTSTGGLERSSVEIGDLNISDWNTAFGWGNHASAGYSTIQNLEDNVDGVAAANTGQFSWEGVGLNNDDITLFDAISPSPTISALGTVSDIDLTFIPKGAGTLKVPAGYEDNINEDGDLINKAYLDDQYTAASGDFTVTWVSEGGSVNTDDAYYSLVNDMLTIQINGNINSNVQAQPVAINIPFSVHASSSFGRVNGSYNYGPEGGSVTGNGLAYIYTSGTPSTIRLSPGVQYTDLDDDDISITFTFRCNDCTP